MENGHFFLTACPLMHHSHPYEKLLVSFIMYAASAGSHACLEIVCAAYSVAKFLSVS